MGSRNVLPEAAQGFSSRYGVLLLTAEEHQGYQEQDGHGSNAQQCNQGFEIIPLPSEGPGVPEHHGLLCVLQQQDKKVTGELN